MMHLALAFCSGLTVVLKKGLMLLIFRLADGRTLPGTSLRFGCSVVWIGGGEDLGAAALSSLVLPF